jgi:CheY-like chemotaxis protein
VSDARAGARVLVVEDDVIIAFGIESQLLAWHYRVVGRVGSGREALELVDAQRPDVVLMDIRLHGAMTGIEAATEIRKRCAIPVIFVTAQVDEKTLASAHTAAPAGIITKPWAPALLRAAIERALAHPPSDGAAP